MAIFWVLVPLVVGGIWGVVVATRSRRRPLLTPSELGATLAEAERKAAGSAAADGADLVR